MFIACLRIDAIPRAGREPLFTGLDTSPSTTDEIVVTGEATPSTMGDVVLSVNTLIITHLERTIAGALPFDTCFIKVAG